LEEQKKKRFSQQQQNKWGKVWIQLFANENKINKRIQKKINRYSIFFYFFAQHDFLMRICLFSSFHLICIIGNITAKKEGKTWKILYFV
jgi:hypothetical protein